MPREEDEVRRLLRPDGELIGPDVDDPEPPPWGGKAEKKWRRGGSERGEMWEMSEAAESVNRTSESTKERGTPASLSPASSIPPGSPVSSDPSAPRGPLELSSPSATPIGGSGAPDNGAARASLGPENRGTRWGSADEPGTGAIGSEPRGSSPQTSQNPSLTTPVQPRSVQSLIAPPRSHRVAWRGSAPRPGHPGGSGPVRSRSSPHPRL
ncbi:hypothetical protein GCM10009799_33130 [Nocardiopsis rhodophaea]|uniref:Uncharacterized protein n=1 Tax=Nocardiopsis rhodophaea TaxID=280238 RepID=A0ABP5ENI4_9ACTN